MNNTEALLKHITANLRRFKDKFPEEHQARLILKVCKESGLVFLESRGSYGYEAEFEDIEL